MIHQYKNNGYNIVLDVNSGCVHAVDELVYDLVNQEISNGRDYILDGFPRNLNQAKWFVENYSEKYVKNVI